MKNRSDETRKYLKKYLTERPLFLSLIRSVEATLYAEHVPLKRPVLDVGCGDGYFAKTVFGFVDAGLDVDGSRMNEAREKGVYKNIVVYDGKIFPFNKNSYRTVVSNCVFEHIPDIRQTVSEIRRVLKPGGRLLTTVMAKPWDEYLFGSIFLGDWYTRYMRKKQVHINLFTRKEWDSVFTSAGFTIKRRVGYMDRRASRVMDICHYVSVPYLVSYMLTGKWVLWKGSSGLFPLSYLARIMSKAVSADSSGALFYELVKA